MKKITEAEADAKANRMTDAAREGSSAGKDAMISAIEDLKLDGDEEIGAIITAAAIIFEAVLKTVATPGVGGRKQANLTVGLFANIIAPALAKVVEMSSDTRIKISIKKEDTDAE